MNEQTTFLIMGIAIVLLYLFGLVACLVFRKIYKVMHQQDKWVDHITTKNANETDKVKVKVVEHEKKITELQQRINHAGKKI